MNKWAIAVAVALGALLEIVDTSIVNVAMADIQAELGATLSEAAWVVTSYSVANVIMIPLAAWLGERVGKKRYFVFSLIGFTLSSAMCGFATSLGMLIVSRVLQGLCGGGLLAKAQAILFETFPKKEQAAAQGLFGVVVISGPAIGPTLGGYLVTNVGWRWIFFVNLPIGVIATMMCLTFIPEDTGPRSKGSIDWISILLLAIGLGSFQTVLEEGQSEDWWSSNFIWFFTISAILAIGGFLYRTLQSPDPVVDFRVLRYRSLWSGCIVSAVVGAGLYGANFAVPVFAQSVLHFTSQQTGLLLLPGAIASAVGMVTASALSGKIDARLQIMGGSLIVVATMYQLNDLTPQTGASDFFWPLITRSLGTVLMFLPLNMSALGAVPKEEVAKATGLFSLTRQLGGSVGVAMLTAVLDMRNAFHRTVIVSTMASNDPHVVDRVQMMTRSFAAGGTDPVVAHGRALAVLDGSVTLQATVMSFSDTFTLTAWAFLGALPLVLLLGKGGRGGAGEAAH